MSRALVARGGDGGEHRGSAFTRCVRVSTSAAKKLNYDPHRLAACLKSRNALTNGRRALNLSNACGVISLRDGLCQPSLGFAIKHWTSECLRRKILRAPSIGIG